jgi:molybdopterin synthase sulfur carrier subunit
MEKRKPVTGDVDVMMKLSIRLFARAKDLAGTDVVALEVPQGATVADLKRQLASRYPGLAGLLERSALAVNDEFADDGLTLPLRAEIALLPPVSGG